MRRTSVLALCLLLMSSAVYAAAYIVREAPGLPDGAFLCDINNSGQGVGAVTGSDGRSHAVRWSADGTVSDLGQGSALDVNNAGQVLCQGASFPFVSNLDGTALDLRTVITASCFPQRMNDQGWIIGNTLTPGMIDRAFVWNSQAGVTVLGVLSGDTYSYSADVNNQGQVIGFSMDGAQTHAYPFIWSSSAGLTPLAVVPGAIYCMPSRINDAGQVVGIAWGNLGGEVALWNPDGTVTDLGPGQAACLNNLGQIAVSSYYGSYLLNPDGSRIELLPLDGANSTEIYGINDQGVVIGKSIWGNGVQERATVWEPEPVEQVAVVTVDLQPDTLNLKSKGNYVTCYIEAESAQDIDTASLRLQESIAPAREGCGIGDYDGDGIPDLMVKFSRAELAATLAPGANTVTLTGRLADGTELVGEDVIRVITGGK